MALSKAVFSADMRMLLVKMVLPLARGSEFGYLLGILAT
jgi:hypothetical protein